MSATARALYLSKTCRGASAFLQAVPTDRHLLLFNCGADAARDMRHNVLVLAFQDMLSDVQNNPVQLEPRAARTGGDHHRFDLAVTGFDSASRNLLLDVTVRSPYAERVIDQAAVNRLEAGSVLATGAGDLWRPPPQRLQTAGVLRIQSWRSTS
eukprot:m.316266 g.316266  ORF g.316266 m.316266 type:complete len:154 (+) comp55459_c0_seq8:1383-1844(+)